MINAKSTSINFWDKGTLHKISAKGKIALFCKGQNYCLDRKKIKVEDRKYTIEYWVLGMRYWVLGMRY